MIDSIDTTAKNSALDHENQVLPTSTQFLNFAATMLNGSYGKNKKELGTDSSKVV